MKEWIFSIIVSVLITTIISIICPEGRLGQIIKCIFSIVLVLIVIKPVLNTNKSGFFIDNDFMIEKEISKDYLIYVYDVKSKSLSIECEDLLSENDIKNSNVTIKYSIDDNYEFNVQIVSVNLSQAVISSSREHIVVIEEIKTILSQKLNVNKDKVNVYG